MKITELYGVIRLNVSNFEAGVSTAIKRTEQFRRDFSKAAADVDRAASRIGIAVGGMATAVVGVTSKMGFEFLQSRDSAEIMLGTILKNGPLAKKTLGDLFEAAKKTPFSFEGLKDGMVQLANAKVAADQLIPSLYKISDAVAAVGGTDADIKGVTYALSQMMTAGRLNAQDMMQLTNRGIAGWDILAQKMNMTVAEVRQLSESGAIDGRAAAAAIIEGMGERFAGAGDKLSLKFQGLWSSFKDILLQQSGIVIEPIYDSLSKALGKVVDGFNRGAYNGLIAQLRSISQRVVEFGERTIKYLIDQGPALAKTAKEWWDFLKPVREFLAKHPELIAALIALKGGQVLGVNQAIASLTSALISGSAAIVNMASSAKTLNAALILLGTGAGIGLALAAIAKFAHWIYTSNKNIVELQKSLKQSDKLGDELAKKQQARENRTIQIAKSQNSPEVAREFLLNELDAAKKNLAGAQASLAGATQQRNDTSWFSKLRDVADSDVRDAQNKVSRLEAYIARLEQEISLIDAKIEADQASRAVANQQGSVGGGQDALFAGIWRKEQEQAEKEARKQQEEAEKEAARRAEEAAHFLWEFNDRLFELRSRIPTEQLNALDDAVQRLAADLANGVISHEEYRQQVDVLNNTINVATDAADAKARLEEQLAELPAAAAGGFQAQINQLVARFQQGELNAFEFRTETEKLAKAMNAAADAAKEQEQAELRALKQRIVSGQGTKDDWQKVFAMQQQHALEQYDQQLNNAFNQIVGLGNVVEGVTANFNNLNLGMQNFADQINQFGGGNAPNPAQAWGAIGATLNSWQGQAAILQNNIALLQQSLTMVSEYPQKKAIEDQIAALEQQLAALGPPPPLFSGSSVEYVDGGRRGSVRIGTQANEFKLEFPNWNPQNSADVKFLADAIVEELARRGRGVF